MSGPLRRCAEGVLTFGLVPHRHGLKDSSASGPEADRTGSAKWNVVPFPTSDSN